MSATASTAHTQADLSKLTVPQLKVICKDKNITGYSKLSKQALIKKLFDNGIGIDLNLNLGLATAATSASQLLLPSLPPAAIEKHADNGLTPTVTNSSNPQTIAAVSCSPEISRTKPTISKARQRLKGAHAEKIAREKSSTTTPSTLGKRSSVQQPLPSPALQIAATDNHDGPKPRDRPDAIPEYESSARVRASVLSRPSAEAMPPPAKKQRVVLPSNPLSGELASVPTLSSTVSRAMQTDRTPLSLGILPAALSSTAGSGTFSVNVPRLISVPPKRFKPLLVDRANLITVSTSSHSSQCLLQPTQERTEHSLPTLEEYVAPVPPLSAISMPPSLAQRKRVYRWAVVLSRLTDKERGICVLVSRMFRYAVYLSASCILTRQYAGQRLQDDVLQKYPQSMTNMWPYLRAREAEVAHRRRIYEASFLARFFRRCGFPNPIAERLWGSPDNSKQLMIAVRFALTRAWFELSVGAARGGKDDPESWLHGTVADVQEVVQGEIWSIVIEYQYRTPSRTTKRDVLYVLEATCEVVGRSTGPAVAAFPVRADWSAYIAARMASASEPPLLSHLKWACTEEYDGGISKVWLKRVPQGDAKRTVAERYVVACVVSNSISGQRMSVHEMAQDFAGLREHVAAPPPSRAKNPTVNLYLPQHHHVESVHFASARGESFHPAVAVVQTPHREYLVLRDNGMQIGCEEEGVAPVWQEVLQCSHLGFAVLTE